MVGQIWSPGCSLLTSDFRTPHFQCQDMWNTKLLINTKNFFNYIIKLLGKWFGKWRFRTRGTALFEKTPHLKAGNLSISHKKKHITWKLRIKYLLLLLFLLIKYLFALVKCSCSKPQIWRQFKILVVVNHTLHFCLF